MAVTSSVNLAVANKVIADVENYIRTNGGAYSAWYAGIATDPEKRLFVDHNVLRNGGQWIYRDCGNDSTSRYVEDYFLRKGCKGDSGGGDSSTKYFYAYKVTSYTRQ